MRDDLIEMPVPPIAIEGKPFVPWQFFQGFLGKAPSTRRDLGRARRASLVVRPAQRDAVGVQVSVANVQGISKIVLTLSAPAEYGIVEGAGRVRGPLPSAGARAVRRAGVRRSGHRAGDVQRQRSAHPADAPRTSSATPIELENPPRIVLDFRKGAAPAPGTPQPSLPSSPREAPGIHTIVIDPGHGGQEVGAVGTERRCWRRTSRWRSRASSPRRSPAKIGARVVLTREDDSVVSLDQRTALANQYKADLFLSVHMNAAVVKDAKGSETYFLSLEASDELARKAAETENVTASRRIRRRDLKLILWDLAQQAYLDESSRFAQAIQEEMNAATGVANRGVKQAPFKVLVGATMPAALVEVGFISNPEEEAKLQTEAFQTTDGGGADACGAAVQDRLRNAHRSDPAGCACARRAPLRLAATTTAAPAPAPATPAADEDGNVA